MDVVKELRTAVEEMMGKRYRKFIIFPFGDVGMYAKHILNEMYGVVQPILIDNKLCRYNNRIKPIRYLKEIGSFCSFAKGVDAVPDHEMSFLATHDIIFAGKIHPDRDIA